MGRDGAKLIEPSSHGEEFWIPARRRQKGEIFGSDFNRILTMIRGSQVEGDDMELTRLARKSCRTTL
jgi:hypothetical protein